MDYTPVGTYRSMMGRGRHDENEDAQRMKSGGSERERRPLSTLDGNGRASKSKASSDQRQVHFKAPLPPSSPYTPPELTSRMPPRTSGGGDSFSAQRFGSNAGFSESRAKSGFKYPPTPGAHQYQPVTPIKSPASDFGQEITNKMTEKIVKQNSGSFRIEGVRDTFKDEMDKINDWRQDMIRKLQDACFRADLLDKENKYQAETIERLREESQESARIKSLLDVEQKNIANRHEEIFRLYDLLKVEIKEIKDNIDSFKNQSVEFERESDGRKTIYEEILDGFKEFKVQQSNKVAKLFEELKDNELEINRLATMLNDTRKELYAEKTAHADTQANHNELQLKFSQLEIKYDALDVQANDLKTNLNEKNASVSSLKSNLTQLANQKTDLESQLTDSVRIVEEKTSEIDDLKNKSKSDQLDILEKEKRIEELNETINQANVSISAKELQLQVLEEQADTLKVNLDQSIASVKELENKLASTVLELNETKETLSTANKHIQDETAARDKLAAEVDKLNETIEEARNKSMMDDQEHSRALEHLQADLSKMTLSFEETSKEKSSLERKVRDLEQRIASVERDLQGTRRALMMANGEVATYQQHKRETEEKNKELKEKIHKMHLSMQEINPLLGSPRIRRSHTEIAPRLLFVENHQQAPSFQQVSSQNEASKPKDATKPAADAPKAQVHGIVPLPQVPASTSKLDESTEVESLSSKEMPDPAKRKKKETSTSQATKKPATRKLPAKQQQAQNGTQVPKNAAAAAKRNQEQPQANAKNTKGDVFNKLTQEDKQEKSKPSKVSRTYSRNQATLVEREDLRVMQVPPQRKKLAPNRALNWCDFDSFDN